MPDVIPVAMIPDPPLLPNKISDDQIVAWLVKAYNGAKQSRYPSSVYVKCISMHYNSLHACGCKLREYHIAPAAWAAFSIDLWKKAPNKRQAIAPITWVFNATMVLSRIELYEIDRLNYRGGQIVENEHSREIKRRELLMQRDLLNADSKGELAIDIKSRYFPGGLYEQLFKAAKRQAEIDQARLDEQAQRGDWMGW